MDRRQRHKLRFPQGSRGLPVPSRAAAPPGHSSETGCSTLGHPNRHRRTTCPRPTPAPPSSCRTRVRSGLAPSQKRGQRDPAAHPSAVSVWGSLPGDEGSHPAPQTSEAGSLEEVLWVSLECRSSARCRAWPNSATGVRGRWFGFGGCSGRRDGPHESPARGGSDPCG